MRERVLKRLQKLHKEKRKYEPKMAKIYQEIDEAEKVLKFIDREEEK